MSGVSTNSSRKQASRRAGGQSAPGARSGAFSLVALGYCCFACIHATAPLASARLLLLHPLAPQASPEGNSGGLRLDSTAGAQGAPAAAAGLGLPANESELHESSGVEPSAAQAASAPFEGRHQEQDKSSQGQLEADGTTMALAAALAAAAAAASNAERQQLERRESGQEGTLVS